MPFPNVLPGPLLFLPETQHHLLQAASQVSLPHTHEMGWHPSLPSTPSPTILPPPQSPRCPVVCSYILSLPHRISSSWAPANPGAKPPGRGQRWWDLEKRGVPQRSGTLGMGVSGKGGQAPCQRGASKPSTPAPCFHRDASPRPGSWDLPLPSPKCCPLTTHAARLPRPWGPPLCLSPRLT